MATAQNVLIDAIKRIAGIDPETLSLLKEIQKRGGIDGIKTQLGGDGGLGEDQRTAEGEDCCTDPGDPPRPWSPPWGDDPATDCATGQPLQFTPGGFPQPESCKECEPDASWQNGYYWASGFYVAGKVWAAPSPNAAFSKFASEEFPKIFESGDYRVDVELVSVSINDGPVKSATVDWNQIETRISTGEQITKNVRSITNNFTGCSAASYESGICTDDAPEICGENWTPDSSTNYTLANGCLVASKCDTDASEQAKQCNDCITVCSGDKEVRICGTLDGGYSVTDMDTGSTTLYSASGVPR